MYPDFKVLIVDDSVLIRTMMKQSLTELGFTNLEEAVDGLEALKKIEASSAEGRPYSVVFLDWNMPIMTGIELIERLKSHVDLASIPLVMISAEREATNIVRALEAGALDFITKPFSPTDLHAKLRRILLDESGPQGSPR